MKIDLLLAGSPCQGFSRNGTGKNFEHEESKLFFNFVEALNILKPRYFLLENVNMRKEWQDAITSYVGVDPIKINSGLVSPQERLRTYWTNIPGVKQPKDTHSKLMDILEEDVPDECFEFNIHEVGLHTNCRNGTIVRNGTKWKGYLRAKYGDGVDMSVPNLINTDRRGRVHKGKIGTLDTNCKWAVAVYKDRITKKGKIDRESRLRWFTLKELERLQCLPDDYTDGYSRNQRTDMIGNGWNINTTAHILSYISEKHLDNVVSLFDGISGGQLTLNAAGITYDQYFASEVDENAIEVTMKHFPDTIQIGDVTKIDWSML